MSTAPEGQPISPNAHILELTIEALRVARSASVAAGEALTTGSSSAMRTLRSSEKELDSLDRDIDDLVTATITGVTGLDARELLACMKIVIALERIGDLLLSFGNRAEAVFSRLHPQDVTDLAFMSSRLERMLGDVDGAFRERSLDRAVSVLRADGEIDRMRNLIILRHLEPGQPEEGRHESFHVIAMAQELERAGDHAKNMAEEVCHLVSGHTIRHVLRTYDRPAEQLFIEQLRAHLKEPQ